MPSVIDGSIIKSGMLLLFFVILWNVFVNFFYCLFQTNPLIIRIETKAGHGAGKPTSKVVSVQKCLTLKKRRNAFNFTALCFDVLQIDECADIYGFVGKVLGIDWTNWGRQMTLLCTSAYVESSWCCLVISNLIYFLLLNLRNINEVGN